MKKRILVFAGTRPEVIKLAPVIFELKKHDQFDVHVCSTGQHKEMLEQSFNDFSITPDRNLNIMLNNQSLAYLSSAVLNSINSVLDELKPDWVIAQGDTTTVAMASLAAFYQKVNIAHIEAGLRSFDKYAPFPEEINRQIVSSIADLHFAPTQTAKENLLKENISADKIIVSGNTVIDSLLWVKTIVENNDEFLPDPVKSWLKSEGKIILVTSHRRENFGQGLENVYTALQQLSIKYPDILFVYPVHLNPNVREPAYRMLSGYPNIALLPPASYKTFIALMMTSHIIITDSGGVQEEAPSLGKPILVTREVTERPEGVTAGTACMVGTNTQAIVDKVSCLLEDTTLYSEMAQAVNPYGDGKASERIVRELLSR